MRITDRIRLNFMIRNSVTFEKYLHGWKAWGFADCSLVDAQPSKLKAIDAAILAKTRKR